MPLNRAVKLFSAQPLASLVMAALFVLMGVALPAGWIPASAIRHYFPGYEWVMAAICCGVAAFFVYCWLVGVRRENKPPRQ